MMRVTLAQLEAFFWTAQLGAVHRAAEHLHLAQPTVSLRLRDLQAAMGIPLIERHGAGMRPTAEGHALLGRVQVVLDGVRNIEALQDDVEISGPLRIGLAEGFASLCLPALISALRETLPAVRPEWVISRSAELEQELVAHQLDLAVMVNPIGHPALRLLPLGLQKAEWVAARTWSLGATVRPVDLCQLPIMSNPPPSSMHRKISDWFASARLQPARLDVCTSVTVIAQLVAAGAAVSILPVKLVAPFISAGSVRVLASDPPVETGRVYVGHAAAASTRVIDVMIRTLREVLASLACLDPEP